MGTPRLLVIDDEPEIGRFVAVVARSSGYDVRATSAPEAFQATYRDWRPDIVVLDLGIPEIDGVELLRFLGQERSRAHILLISGMGSGLLDVVERLGAAYNLRIAATMPKPIRAADLRTVLEELRDTPEA